MTELITIDLLICDDLELDTMTKDENNNACQLFLAGRP